MAIPVEAAPLPPVVLPALREMRAAGALTPGPKGAPWWLRLVEVDRAAGMALQYITASRWPPAPTVHRRCPCTVTQRRFASLRPAHWTFVWAGLYSWMPVDGG